jgi:uncharacterized integral membrane protein
MAAPYKRRKSSSFIRNVWVYRWLIVSAFVLGTLLWFIVANGEQVQVYLPFGLGHPTASIGLIILGSSSAGAVLGGALTFLVMTLRRYRASGQLDAPETQNLPDDRPPTDYASKTPEGFSDAPWSAR